MHPMEYGQCIPWLQELARQPKQISFTSNVGFLDFGWNTKIIPVCMNDYERQKQYFFNILFCNDMYNITDLKPA